MTQSTETPQQRTVFKVLIAISFAHFLNDMMQSVIPSIYPMLKQQYGFTFGQIGVITLVYQMTACIFQPFVGRYADRHPLPFSLAIGMLFTMAGILAVAFASSFGLILVAVGLVGWGSSVFHPESSRIAQMAAGHRKGLAQSIFQVGGNGGSAVGPLLAATMIIPLGQHAIGWLAIVAMVAAAVLFKVGLWYKRRLATMVSDNAATCPAAMTRLSPGKIKGAFTLLVILVFSKYFFMACMTSYFTFFLIDKFGIDIRSSQLCLFAFLGAVAIGTIAGGHIGDKHGRKRVILWSIFGAAIPALFLPYAGLTMTIILAVLSGLIIASAFSAILVYATELKPGQVGQIAGIFFGLMFGLGGIGSAFFGWLADVTSIEFIFKVSTLLPLLGIVAVMLPDIESRQSAKANR